MNFINNYSRKDEKYIICFLLLQISYSQTNPQQVEQDTLVSAFFGLDNALPSIFCNQLGSLLYTSIMNE